MRQTPHFGKRTKTLPTPTDGSTCLGMQIARQSRPKRATLAVWCADDDKENIPPEDLLNLKNKQTTVDSPVLLRKLSSFMN